MGDSDGLSELMGLRLKLGGSGVGISFYLSHGTPGFGKCNTSGPDVEQGNIWSLPVIGLLLGMERSFHHFKHQPVALSPSW